MAQNLGKDFKESFHLLAQHKVIIVPLLLSVVVPLLMALLFLHASGLQPVLQEISSERQAFEEYREQRLDEEIPAEERELLLASYVSDDAYEEAFASFVDKEPVEQLFSLITPASIGMLVAFLLVSLLLSFYFGTMANTLIARTMQREATFRGILGETTRRFVSYLTARILVQLIIVGPLVAGLVLLGFLTMTLMVVNALLGMLGILLLVGLIVGYLAYAIYMGSRLMFSEPRIFLEGDSSMASIRQSLSMTRHHVWRAILIFVLLWAMMLFTNSYISRQIDLAAGEALFGVGWMPLVYGLLLVLLLIIEAALLAYQHVFLFYAYKDF